MSVAIALPPPLPDLPYPGIDAFRLFDQLIFAARDDEIWDLVSNVTLYSAVLLYGDSGVGKSSLINAGLLPQALEQNYIVDRLRVQPYAGREIKIEPIEKTGGEHPVYLPSNFTPVETEEDSGETLSGSESFELSISEFRQQLQHASSTKRVRGHLDAVATEKRRPLLIFDQFEEFITLFEEVQHGSPTEQTKLAKEQAPQTQREILKTLVDLVQGRKFPAITVVFSFREDYLAKLNILFDSCPELLDQSQRLLPPSFEELPAIIRAPFENDILRQHFLSSAKLSERPGSELNELLAQEIATALELRNKGEPVNLTELQIVCLRLWQTAEPHILLRQGVDNILTDYADEVFVSLPAELREGAIELLSHMVTWSNTRNIISEHDLLSRARDHVPVSQEQLLETLELMCKNQLIRRERRRNLHFYELASEYFVPFITEKVAEQTAIEEQVKTRNERRELAERRAEAIREYRRLRRSKRFTFAFGALFVAVCVLVILAGFLYRKSVEKDRQFREQELARAETFRQLKEKSLTAITVLGGQTDAEKLQALEQIKKWNEAGDFPPEFVAVLVGALSTTENPQIKQAILGLSQVVAQAAKTDASLSQLIGKAAETNSGLAEKLPPRFYIHIANDNQRPMALKVANALKHQGYLVPGIQVVSAQVWDYELRYFRKGEEGTPEPAAVLSLLKQTTGSNWIDSYNPRYANSPNVSPGHFEIWFPAPTGQLVLSFANEEGNAINVTKAEIRFEPLWGLGVSFRRSRPGPIAVPPGDYNVTIKVSGYKEVERKLSIQAGGEVDWRDLKLQGE